MKKLPFRSRSTALLRGSREVLECGAHSMKFHSAHRQRAEKFSYPLGHEVFTTGRISRATTARIIAAIEARRERPRLCVATSAIREAENREYFIREMRRILGLDVRVLSEWEEISLLALAYLTQSPGELPALVTDLGGGSLEVVHLGTKEVPLWSSLPLGAIRLHHVGTGRGGWHEKRVTNTIESHFARAVLPKAEAVYAIGGTVKAIAKVVGKRTVTKDEIIELEARVRSEGPPGRLRLARAQVFLPGLLVVRKLLDFTFAERLEYLKGVSVGRLFLASLEREVELNAEAAGGARQTPSSLASF